MTDKKNMDFGRCAFQSFSLVALLILWPGQGVLAAVDSTPRISLQAASDSLYHGLSETGGRSVYGMNIEANLSNALYVGVQAHDANPIRARQRHRSVLGYIGIDQKILQKINLGARYTRRAFPGDVREWDYSEYSAQLWLDSGWRIGIDYAPDYYRQNVRATISDIGYEYSLSERIYLRGNAGYAAFSATRDYSFAGVSVGVVYQTLNVELGYHWNDFTAPHRFGGPLTSPDLLLRLSYRLW